MVLTYTCIMMTRDGLEVKLELVNGSGAVLYNIGVYELSFPVERARGLSQTGSRFQGSRMIMTK